MLLGLLAYGWAAAGQFVYDDYHSVHDNPALKDLSELPRLLWDVDAFSALDNRMYRPVLLVSFSLTHALFGMSLLMATANPVGIAAIDLIRQQFEG